MSDHCRATITVTVAHADDRYALNKHIEIGSVRCSPRTAAIKELADSCACMLRRALVEAVEEQGGKVLLQGPRGETADVTRL